MRTIIISTLRPTFAFLVLLTLLFGGIYPGIATGIIQGLFPSEAQGSLISGKDGRTLGSHLIGQNFSDPKYFWSRISATTPYPYNASNSTGSNLGSNNTALTDEAKGRIDALHQAAPENTSPVPADLATSSASGLDPQLSPASAEYQVARVAKARGLDEGKVRELVQLHMEPRQFGILGEPRVNVLELNLALDGKL